MHDRNKLLGFTRNEQRVYRTLSTFPQSLADIEKKAKIPHSSCADTLERFLVRGIVKKTLPKNGRPLWFLEKISTASINNEKSHGHSPVLVLEGKENLLTLIDTVMMKHRGRRMKSYHGAEVVKGWLHVLPSPSIKKRNDLIVANDIIVERYVPERSYKKLFMSLPKEWQRTMFGRTHITYLLPEEYFGSKTEVMLFPDVAMVYETHQSRVTLFRDKETVMVFEKMFLMMEHVGRKVNSEDLFGSYLGV